MSRKDLKKIMRNNEQTIMDYRQVREEYISRVEVLERVKKLFTIPNLDCMLLKQVADYYEVSIDSVKGIYNRYVDTDYQWQDSYPSGVAQGW